ncbi:MAG: flavodoxin domain-containing protein [Thermoplasmata archaeon]|nr:flavodoxin domain-containing protein [Thermoplasmata archaeon]
MKAIVIYSSKTGFVEKYAKWIADELSVKAVRTNDVKVKDLKDYDTIIFGGGLYAGGINGIKLIKKNLDTLKGKNIILFATGASPGRTEEIDAVWDKNFTKKEQKNMTFFYLRGGFNYDKLNMKDKMLMKLLKKKLQNTKDLTEDEEGMLAAYDEPVDFTERENIRDLIDLVRKNRK